MLALLRKKAMENWTEKHRNVARKIFLEGGWTQKRLFDVDWSDTSQCRACKKEESNRKAQAFPHPRMVRSQTRDSRSFLEVGRWCNWILMNSWVLMSGSMEAEFEAQRTIKESGVDSLFVPPRKSMWTFKPRAVGKIVKNYMSWLKEVS